MELKQRLQNYRELGCYMGCKKNEPNGDDIDTALASDDLAERSVGANNECYVDKE
jgi:hypothetical protein